MIDGIEPRQIAAIVLAAAFIAFRRRIFSRGLGARLALVAALSLAILALFLHQRKAGAGEAGFPFSPGETMTFTLKAFKMTMANQTLAVSAGKPVDGRPTIELTQHTKSAGVGSAFGKMDNRLVSILDPKTFKPVRFLRSISESDWKSDDVFDFFPDRVESREKRGINLDELRNQTIKFDPGTAVFDEVALIYRLRATPLELGKTYAVNVLQDEKVERHQFKAVRKEKIKIKPGAFTAWYVEGTLNDSKFWVDDGPERMVLKYDVQTNIARVTGYLQDYRAGKKN